MRSAEGGYSERHLPLSPDRAYVLAARERDPDALPEETTDHNGVPPPGRDPARRLRRRLHTLYYADSVPKPTETSSGRARSTLTRPKFAKLRR